MGNVTTMEFMFSGANAFNGTISDWDVSNVTTMKFMLSNATAFNGFINNWDTSNVTNMQQLFGWTTVFNQPLDNWDTSNVTTMKDMFVYASSFNQPLNNWNVSSVTDMHQMFGNASSFNQPLNNWDVSNVQDMYTMFYGATSFNQPLNNWNVGSATTLWGMFGLASSFNQPLNDWNVSNTTDMTLMFFNAVSFNQPLNNWNVSNVLDMSDMFRGATSFNEDISDWDFNTDIILAGSQTFPQQGFVTNSGLDTENYDALLLKFVQLNLQNKTMGATAVEYCNADVRSYLVSELGWTIYGDSQSGNCGDNTITGNIFYDENNNGCDTADVAVISFLINADSASHNSSAFANATGQYTLNVYDGTYSVGLLNLPPYFSVTPQNSTVTLTGSDDNENLSFCLSSNQTIQDLNIVLVPVTVARPGFEGSYQLVIQNMGTQTVSNVTISLVYDSAMQTFVSATPIPASATANQLNFTVASLQPLEVNTIDIVMQTFAPPTVTGGDILNFTATITPNTNDLTVNDNVFELAQVVANSYDPNDKQVLEGNTIHIDQAGEYLHYIVRFQNTGTASAVNVRIEDILDETMNWNTLQILSSSHDYRVEISEGNEIDFIFENINLPYQSQNDAGSNGFIAYKIKPAANTQVGNIITGNEASIYFDYNAAIVTNLVNTEVVDTMNIPAVGVASAISVYPNPAADVLNIQVSGNMILEGVELYNL